MMTPPPVFTRTVASVSNDVSRYGYVTPIVFVHAETPADLQVCLPVYGTSVAQQLTMLTLVPGDRISLTLDPFAGYNRVVPLNPLPLDWSQHPFCCHHCNHTMIITELGLRCTNTTCNKRLASRLAYLGSDEGLDISILTPDTCALFVCNDQWFRSLDQLFDVSFAYRTHSVLGPINVKQIENAIKIFKRHLRNPNPLNTMSTLVSCLLNSLSIPGFTPKIIGTFVHETILMGQDPLAFIVAALEQPEIMERLGIPHFQAISTARDASFFSEELANIQYHLFDLC